MAQNLPSSDIKPWTRPAPKGYKFTNAHIVDVASGTIIENQTLIATDGKITYLGQESSAPTELETVDCQGKYLSLGLFDVYIHLYAILGFSDLSKAFENLNN
ncbi:Metal-dependent hydrolase, composite domain [Penicillium roqueforti FM164]|uniref:Metal-dependent hydrolase, composite domain n=1 Tax=Penicillium roqueforti (strain FM164) TaxID=1365484 RepID=W6QTQ4_PENRF|nr:Metal-dependent hydrolase, composite domain [Penicillium roqueforti FM164]